MSRLESPMPPDDCRRAREAYGLRLADGLLDTSAAEHARACADCRRAVERMERLWSLGDELRDRFAPPSEARLDEILERVLAGRYAPAGADAPVETVVAAAARTTPGAGPMPAAWSRASASRREAVGFSVGLALAASLIAFAVIGPDLVPKPAPSPAAVAAREAALPVAPSVILAAANGEVTHVPADGSVMPALKVGDELPPGLFSAGDGAALSIEGEGLLVLRGDATLLLGGVARSPLVSVARGEIFVDLPKGTIDGFHVRTPNGTVRVTGTQFDVKVEPRGTVVGVTRGSVVVSGPDGETEVKAGQEAELKPGMPPVSIVVSEPSIDALGWVRALTPDRAPPPPVTTIAARTVGPREAKPGAAAIGKADPAVHAVPGLDRIAVENAMEKRGAAMRFCYEQALARTPDLVVRAQIAFRVDEAGGPKDLRVSGLPAAQAVLQRCLLDAARAAVLPATAPGTEIDVNYPVRFEPIASRASAPATP